MPVKALLLLDNAPSHPNENELKSEDGAIVAMFMPPNVTPLIQPMDQNVIRITKLLYRNSLLAAIFSDERDLAASIKKITLRDAVTFLNTAWSQVGQGTIEKCWRNILSFGNLIEEEDEDNIPLSILKLQMKEEATSLAEKTAAILQTLAPEVYKFQQKFKRLAKSFFLCLYRLLTQWKKSTIGMRIECLMKLSQSKVVTLRMKLQAFPKMNRKSK